MLNPTVGRVVYYNTGVNILAAIISWVWSDTCVNLMVIDPYGNTSGKTRVYNGQGPYEWDWMPYQKQKAANGDHNSESAEPRPQEG